MKRRQRIAEIERLNGRLEGHRQGLARSHAAVQGKLNSVNPWLLLGGGTLFGFAFGYLHWRPRYSSLLFIYRLLSDNFDSGE